MGHVAGPPPIERSLSRAQPAHSEMPQSSWETRGELLLVLLDTVSGNLAGQALGKRGRLRADTSPIFRRSLP